MERDAEAARLERLFGLRRDRLLDLGARNPLISYKHRPTSKRQLRLVDAALDSVFGLEPEAIKRGEGRPLDALLRARFEAALPANRVLSIQAEASRALRWLGSVAP